MGFLRLSGMEIKTPETQCKGLIFRGYSNIFSDFEGKIKSHKELKLLKRRSCKGCLECKWFWDFLYDTIKDNKKLLDNIEHGKLYTVQPHSGVEWETGFEELEYITFIEVTQ